MCSAKTGPTTQVPSVTTFIQGLQIILHIFMWCIFCGVGWGSNLIVRVVLFELLMFNVLYGHYYLFNYISYDQKIAN